MLINSETRKRQMLFSCFLLFILFLKTGSSQWDINERQKISKDKISNETIFQKNNFGIQLNASVLPKAIIRVKEGAYVLDSRLHSSFGLGISNTINFNQTTALCTDILLNLIKCNFYKTISNSELNGLGIVLPDDAPPIIYYRDVYSKLSVPAIFVKRVRKNENQFWDIRSGIRFNYSGYASDVLITMSDQDIYNQQAQVFSCNLKAIITSGSGSVFLFRSKKFYFK